MKLVVNRRCAYVSERAYLLTEALVYIGVIFVLLGVGYAAMYRCIENSVKLRRNADDIASALHAGERWRADVRDASQVRREDSAADQTIYLSAPGREVAYRLSTGDLFRQVGPGPWVRFLTNVKSSTMEADPREKVTAWRWELELAPRAKAGRMRPLFTFIAVPQPSSAK